MVIKLRRTSALVLFKIMNSTGSRWSPVRTLLVAPLWCDLGFVPNSRGNKAAANLRPISPVVPMPTLGPPLARPLHSLRSTQCHLKPTSINWYQVGCLLNVTKVLFSSDSSKKMASYYIEGEKRYSMENVCMGC